MGNAVGLIQKLGLQGLKLEVTARQEMNHPL